MFQVLHIVFVLFLELHWILLLSSFCFYFWVWWGGAGAGGGWHTDKPSCDDAGTFFCVGGARSSAGARSAPADGRLFGFHRQRAGESATCVTAELEVKGRGSDGGTVQRGRVVM